MIWFRIAMIAMFSVTALSVTVYQGIEVFHAFQDLFQNRVK
ncbi:hypothetical protein SAMN04487944_103202 [Gracilibacillus ureilyticus]|uniref:Uncharacterized protein n=1 Tax=Gracilibacillus ureilyticus TaxID=531814 RepID=A0A1H9NLC9_9BACI|nr:hypothetical protein [Gracilibacillus ureilyticus]SER36702.1 hypothetical protein SAMN04487944_103202 [Gracilibacillus ureilyticus]